jgi:hypothetical protein
MQEIQPTPRAPAVRVVYEMRRRPGPAKQVTGNEAALLMVASQVAISLIGGFASALLTACSHSACAPSKEKVMSAVQPTLIANVPVRSPVVVLDAARGQRRRPGPAQPAVVIDSTGVTVAVDATTGARFTRLTHGTLRDRRCIAVQWIPAQRMHAEMISAQPIPANCRPGEQSSRRRLHAARSTAMARATSASGQPVTISPAGAFDARSATPDFSLRYPRGN